MDQRPASLVPQSEPTPRWWLWALVGVTLLGGTLRFAALGAKTVWLDEAFTLWMARHDLPSLFAWLVRIDHHPPLYYLLLHLWINLHDLLGGLGDSPSALRSLSALTSTLTIPIHAAAARKLAGERVAIVAALLLTLAPFHVRYAQEARMYALLTLAVALLFFALAHLLTVSPQKNPPERVSHVWLWILLAVAEAAAMLTHNTATVLIPLTLNVTIGALWLAQRTQPFRMGLDGLNQPKFLQAWLWSQVGALLLWSPWAWPFVQQAQVVDADFWIAPPDLFAVWTTLVNLTFAHLPGWMPFRSVWAFASLGLALWGMAHWGFRCARTWLLAALWLLPPIVELLVSLRRPIFYDRTLIWITLPYYLLIARGIIAVPDLFAHRTLNGSRLWQLSWLLTYTTLCGLGLWGYYDTFAKEDWDKAARHVATQAQAHDLILFHASWSELPFDYHYPDEAPALVQHGIPADLFDAGTLEPPMTSADMPRLRELTNDTTHLWLVYSHWWYTDPEGLLLQALDEEFELVEEKEWPGLRVLYYVRQEATGP